MGSPIARQMAPESPTAPVCGVEIRTRANRKPLAICQFLPRDGCFIAPPHQRILITQAILLICSRLSYIIQLRLRYGILGNVSSFNARRISRPSPPSFINQYFTGCEHTCHCSVTILPYDNCPRNPIFRQLQQSKLAEKHKPTTIKKKNSEKNNTHRGQRVKRQQREIEINILSGAAINNGTQPNKSLTSWAL